MAGETRTGGRPASAGVIPGDFALSVGRPDRPAPPGWRWTALADVARLETGHTPSRRHPEYWEGDIPWIGIKDATENHGRVISDTYQHTNELGITNSSARILPARTVCLSRTASVGYVVVMGRPMATSQDFVNWVCSDAIDHRFLKYVLLAEREAFLRFASGTTHQTIYFPEVKAFHVCLPRPNEQRAIAEVLTTIDDKIELNRRMCETLEAIAQALFKSWFVDFDPVRAKAQGRDTGLPDALAALFPDLLDDSVFGEVPQGWRFGPLGELVLLTRGRTYKSSLKGLTGPVLLGLASIERNGGFRDDKLSTYGGDSPSDLLLGPGDLFASLKDVTQSADLLGAIARVPAHVTRGRLTQDTVRMDFRSRNASREIVYRSLLTPTYRQYCRSHATGTTNLGLSRDDFLAYPIVQPSEAVQRAFEEVTDLLGARVAAAAAESRTLSTLRDELLPRLISGAVRVESRAAEVSEFT